MRVRSFLAIALVVALTGSLIATLPPAERASAHVGSPEARAAVTPPTPPPQFNCVGYGAALTVLTPSTATGIPGTVFGLEGSGYYNRTSGPLGNFTIWMANYTGGSLLFLTLVPAGDPVRFFVNVTVPAMNHTAPFAPGPYEFWSLENYSLNRTCANTPFTLTAAPPVSLGCLSWTAILLVVSPSPAQGPSGSNVSLQGRDFSHVGSTTVYWAETSGSLDSSVATASASDPQGWFNVTVQVPTGYPPGTYVFWAVDSAFDCAGAQFVVTSSGPSLVLAPTSGIPGSVVAATGTGFAADSTIIFTFDGGAVTSTCSSNSSGSFPGGTGTPCTLVVPAVQVGDDGGQNVVATDTLSNSASASFSVSQWFRITSTPTTGPAGSTVTTVAAGWPAGETISYVVFGVSLLGISAVVSCTGGTPVVNASGGWTCSFSVPAIKPGTYWAIAVTTAGLQFSNNTFTVSGLTITSTPTTGPVGTPVTATATGWIPGDHVVIGVGPVGIFLGNILAGTTVATVDSAGGFTASFDFPAVPGGAYWVLAYDTTQYPDGGPGTLVNSTNSFTLTGDLTITNSIRSGGPGTTVTTVGMGWPAGETISHVVFGVSLLGISAIVSCAGGNPEVDPTGSFTCNFPVPDIAPGTYWAIAVTGAGLQFSNNTFTVSGLTITSSPTTGSVGTPVTAAGTGWVPGDHVVIGVGPVGIFGVSILTGTTVATVDSTGGFTASFDFPAAPGGAYWVIGYDSTQNPGGGLGTLVNSTNSFTLTSSLMITSNPTTGPVGTPVTVVGVGWPTGETMSELVFGVSLLGISAVVSCTGGAPVVDVTGQWTCSFTVPSIHTGTYSVIAVTSAGTQYSSNTFTVTSPTGVPAGLFGIPWFDLEVLGASAVLVAAGAAVVVLRGRRKAPPVP